MAAFRATRQRYSRLKSVAARLIPFVLAAVAAWVLWRELRGLSPAQIGAAIAVWSPGRILAALGLVASSYGLLVLNEQFALRWTGARVRLSAGATASFTAYALANNLGLGVIVGGALRASVYARYGVSLVQVAKVTAYGTATFSMGVAALAGVSFLRAPDSLFAALHIAAPIGRVCGMLLSATPGFYILACALLPREMIVLGHCIRPPRAVLAVLQVLFGMADVALSAAVLWVLLGPSAPHYTSFLASYLISVVSGLLSGVPGGVGVFEGAMLLLSPSINRGALAAGLLGYRLFYYLTPLAIALCVLLIMRVSKHPPAPPTPTPGGPPP
jgi:uncharacterized membrane protein YbhN (UPF0104 family)